MNTLSGYPGSTTLMQRLHIDLPLLMLLLALAGLGLFVLYSAGNESMGMMHKQLVRLAVAFAAMFMLAQVTPETLMRWAPKVYLLGLALLVAVLFMGVVGKGAQRWLDLGFFRFQPSEMMKIAVPMMVAWYMAERPMPPTNKVLSIGFVLVLIPTILIAKQPDLGTSLLIASSGVFVLLFAGMRWKLIFGGILLFIPSAVLLWFFGMHDYQKQRVLTFLNPESDPLGSGYHIIQSKIAIGSGGLYGKGWLEGTQSHLEFLPERHTDFIFAVLTEELGFYGALLLLALYLGVIIRGLIITVNAQHTFSKLLAGSLTMTFLVYFFVNIGMVTGLLPVVGLPLPMISYGGSSMVTLLASFGILMSLQTHRKLLKN